MATSSERIRAWNGPAIFSYGFRPFFLGAAAFAAIAMVTWILAVTGAIALPVAYDPVAWHAHEFLWGYLPAVVAGFLLTAVPNWTGRLPIVGPLLALLFAIWLAGRLAVSLSAFLPLLLVAIVDVSFLVVFAFFVVREIVAGKNWRNLKVIVVVSLLAVANAVFHVEAMSGANAASGYGVRLGLAAAILLITVIGGRIVPSFTRNWLARRGPGQLPAEFGTIDKVILGVTAAALVSWIGFPEAAATAILCLAAGLANLYRLYRWAGWRSFAEPLVTILHVGFLFVPLGFLLTGISGLWPDLIPRPAAQHAWMAGAIAVMTLAVMTRASLGHTGQPLTASRPVTAIYVCAVAAALSRVVAGIVPGLPWLIDLAGLLWILAFGGFVVVYAPLLAVRRRA